jgi:CheY-like chemotaxis protein
VVEDNAMNQMVIKMIKKWLNTTVLYANNGQEGLDVFKTNKIDIVLMDLQMPVMDGMKQQLQEMVK